MKKNGSTRLTRTIRLLFTRYHMTMFIVLIIGCLAAAVLFLNGILTDATIGQDYQSPITAGSIDQQTLDQINSLHASNETLPAAQIGGGRTNPFGE